jgi:hypothetical protein
MLNLQLTAPKLGWDDGQLPLKKNNTVAAAPAAPDSCRCGPQDIPNNVANLSTSSFLSFFVEASWSASAFDDDNFAEAWHGRSFEYVGGYIYNWRMQPAKMGLVMTMIFDKVNQLVVSSVFVDFRRLHDP